MQHCVGQALCDGLCHMRRLGPVLNLQFCYLKADCLPTTLGMNIRFAARIIIAASDSRESHRLNFWQASELSYHILLELLLLAGKGRGYTLSAYVSYEAPERYAYSDPFAHGVANLARLFGAISLCANHS